MKDWLNKITNELKDSGKFIILIKSPSIKPDNNTYLFVIDSIPSKLI